MKAIYLLFPLVTLLAACGATAPIKQDVEKLNYIDLTSDELRNKFQDYWRISKKVESRYPVEAAKEGFAGCVELMTVINSKGKAQGYKILSSYPKNLFDEAAARSLSAWAWVPTTENTSRQPILTHIRIDFTIDSQPVGEKYFKNCPIDKTLTVDRSLTIVGKITKR
jgi:TonB family protein